MHKLDLMQVWNTGPEFGIGERPPIAMPYLIAVLASASDTCLPTSKTHALGKESWNPGHPHNQMDSIPPVTPSQVLFQISQWISHTPRNRTPDISSVAEFPCHSSTPRELAALAA